MQRENEYELRAKETVDEIFGNDPFCPTDVIGANRTEEDKAKIREILEKYTKDQKVQS